MRCTYAVFLPASRWGRTNNKRDALRMARSEGGYVNRMPYTTETMDSHYFRQFSEVIADYRVKGGLV